MHVPERDQVRRPRIDEARGEHSLRLVVLALGEKPAGGLEAGAGQLIEVGGLRGIAVDLSLARIVGHARFGQADACRDSDTGQQQVNGRGTVGAAQLDRLRVVRQLVDGRLGGVRITEHRVVDVLPSQGHAHEDGAVTVAPANRRGRLLMRHEAQEGGGDRVAEGGEGSCMRQVTADDLQGRLRQARPGRELVDTVLNEAGVEVHARPGLTDRDLRRERDVNAVGVGDFAQHPLGEHHLVGGIEGVHGQEFDLLLDHLATVGHKVTDLRVGVLDRASHGHQVQQGFRAHALPLREGARFVVAALRFDGEQVLLV